MPLNNSKLEVNLTVTNREIVLDRAFEERITAAITQNRLERGSTVLVAGQQIRHEPGYVFGYPWLSDYHLVMLTDRYEGNEGQLNLSGKPGQGGQGGTGGQPGLNNGKGNDSASGDDGTNGGNLTLFAREITSAWLVSAGGVAGTAGTGGTGASGDIPGSGGNGGKGGRGGDGGNLQVYYTNLPGGPETLVCFNDGGSGGHGGQGGYGGIGPNDQRGDGGTGGQGGDGGKGGDRDIAQLDESEFEERVVAALGDMSRQILKDLN